MQQPTSTVSRLSVGTKVALAALGILLSCLVLISINTLFSGTSSSLPTTKADIELGQRYGLLSKQIVELINEEEAANLAALSKAKRSLSKTFKTYSSRVPRFSEEIASLRTRLSIAAKSSSAPPQKNSEADEYIRKIFAEKVVTSRKMAQDVKKIVVQFQADLDANRQILVEGTAKRIHEARLYEIQHPDHEQTLRQKMASAIYAEQKRLDKHTDGIKHQSYDGKGIAEESAETLNAQIIRMSTTNILIEVLVQAGTAVGFVIGLGIGYLADEWLSMRLQKKVTKKTREALTRMQQDIWQNPKSGMKVKMERAIQQNRQISTAAVDKVILGALS